MDLKEMYFAAWGKIKEKKHWIQGVEAEDEDGHCQMNIENLDRLIAAIEEPLRVLGEEVEFDMCNWVTAKNCGMAACIGGHCQILEGVPISKDDYSADSVAKFLGISEDEAFRLCYASGFPLEDVSKEGALTTLRLLRETGEVDWKHIT